MLPILIFVLFYKKFKSKTKVFFIFVFNCLLSIISTIAARLISVKHQTFADTNYVYNFIYNILLFVNVAYVIIYFLEPQITFLRTSKRRLIASIIASILLAASYSLGSSYLITVMAILIASISIMYYMQIINGNYNKALTTISHFWFVTAMFFYFLCSFFIKLALILLGVEDNTIKAYRIIEPAIAVVSNTMLIFGLYLEIKQRKQPQNIDPHAAFRNL